MVAHSFCPPSLFFLGASTDELQCRANKILLKWTSGARVRGGGVQGQAEEGSDGGLLETWRRRSSGGASRENAREDEHKCTERHRPVKSHRTRRGIYRAPARLAPPAGGLQSLKPFSSCHSRRARAGARHEAARGEGSGRRSTDAVWTGMGGARRSPRGSRSQPS